METLGVKSYGLTVTKDKYTTHDYLVFSVS